MGAVRRIVLFFVGTFFVAGLFSRLEKKQSLVAPPLRVQRPQLTVVVVVDQFAYHYIDRLAPFFTGFFKKMLNQSLFYKNASYPHAMPSTSSGHAGLSTGALPCKHGIVANSWVDSQGKSVYSTDDPMKKALIFAQGKKTARTVSAGGLEVDALADAFVLQSKPGKHCVSYAISYKQRSAALLAGRMGKAFWFEEDEGRLTTSMAYYSAEPTWVHEFNKNHLLEVDSVKTWTPMFKLDSKAYEFYQIENYEHASLKSLFGTSFKIPSAALKRTEVFMRTPFSDKLTLDAAIDCLKVGYHPENNDHCLLFVSLSSLDLAGHMFGPHSRETIDMLYHLDKNLADFFETLQAMYHQDPLIVVTGDHGVMPIPEVLNDAGFSLPVRIDVNKLVKEMNKVAQSVTGVDKLIHSAKVPQFYMDKSKLARLSLEMQTKVKQRLKNYLKKQPYIVSAWTDEELSSGEGESSSYRQRFVDHTYPGRSGELLCLLPPYYMLTEYSGGTSHTTPYDYDVHVPLFVNWDGRIKGGIIDEPVSVLQVAHSISQLLGISSPSASDRRVLPEFPQVVPSAI